MPTCCAVKWLLLCEPAHFSLPADGCRSISKGIDYTLVCSVVINPCKHITSNMSWNHSLDFFFSTYCIWNVMILNIWVQRSIQSHNSFREIDFFTWQCWYGIPLRTHHWTVPFLVPYCTRFFLSVVFLISIQPPCLLLGCLVQNLCTWIYIHALLFCIGSVIKNPHLWLFFF